MLVLSHQDPSNMQTLIITLLSSGGFVESKKVSLPTLGQNRKKTTLWSSISWINGNYLQGALYEKRHTGDELWDTWLLNPYQLDWKSLENLADGLNRAEASGFSISPDMTRVLYVNEQYQLVLHDLIQNRSLWEYSDYDGINPVITSPTLADAIWSEDGTMLALPISRDSGGENWPGVLILDQYGKIVHLMDFGMRQFGLSWSNDKQYVSFYGNQYVGLDLQSDMQPIIRVMDINDGLVRDLCRLGEGIEPVSNIFWSPDQKFLTYYLQNIKADQDKFIIQKLSDPRLRALQLYDDNHELIYFQFVGWSKYHWTSANLQP